MFCYPSIGPNVLFLKKFFSNFLSNINAFCFFFLHYQTGWNLQYNVKYRRGYSCLFPNDGKIRSFVIQYDINYRFSIIVFFQIEDIPFYFKFFEIFLKIRMDVGFCQVIFYIYLSDCMFSLV